MEVAALLLLGAVGMLWSYLSFRDFPWLLTIWGNLVAFAISFSLFVLTIHLCLAAGYPWLLAFVLVGVAAGLSHCMFVAGAVSNIISGIMRWFSGDRNITVRPTFDKANAAAARRDYAAAERLYTEAVNAYPDDPTPLLRLADLHLTQGHLAQAAVHLRQAAGLAGGPEQEATIVFRLAELFALRMGKPDEARDALEAFIRTYPNTKYAEFAQERIAALV